VIDVRLLSLPRAPEPRVDEAPLPPLVLPSEQPAPEPVVIEEPMPAFAGYRNAPKKQEAR
jgi:hypothetical protein